LHLILWFPNGTRKLPIPLRRWCYFSNRFLTHNGVAFIVHIHSLHIQCLHSDIIVK
jgi:hypothetical protein